MSEQTYSGRVSSVMFQREDFRIAKVALDGGSSPSAVTVSGHFPAQVVDVGSWVSFAGRWVKHPQYGKQLKVTRSPISVSWTEDRVLSALAANEVGPRLRLNLRDLATTRGVGLAELLDGGDLDGLTGSDEVTRLYVVQRWRALRTQLDGARFLSEAGVPARVISKVWAALGDELEEKITEDPWILVRVGGISFKEADEVAVRLGVSLDNPGRINGAVLTAVQEVAVEGHVFASTGQVLGAAQRLIPGPQVSAEKVASAIGTLVGDKQLVVERGFREGLVALYEPWSSAMEKGCADFLHLRQREAVTGMDPDEGKTELEKWAVGHKVTLTPTQMDAALRVLTEPISVLTGLPGTGKTTTLQAAVAILREMAVPFLLVAPTGIAAKRLSTVTGTKAATVHRAFSAKGFETREREATYVGVVGNNAAKASGNTKGEDWGYGPENPHPAQVVIVDESSMLDLHMLYRVLGGTLETCRLVFVGDPYQLPSVGAGDVLRDLVSSGCFPHTHLTQIFRQADTSSIITAAHAVHAGQTPDMEDRDFLLIPADTEEEAAFTIRSIAQRLYAKRANFQVLSPRHKGGAGVTTLNELLRMALNPPSPGLAERRIMGDVVREGDRIMVVKNDYDHGVYNGDIGKISRIDHRAKELEIKVFGGGMERLVRYNVAKHTPPIRLAYCQTIHKSQGQEYDVIVVPMFPSFGRQLQRNLLYTAITRARRRVFIVGSAGAVSKAVANDRADRRNTLLADRIGALCGVSEE